MDDTFELPPDARRVETAPGVFRRRVILQAATGVVHAGVEDTQHHFELRLAHDGQVVTGIAASAPRTPWSLCPAASAQLQRLLGEPIGTDVFRRRGLPDPLAQCTHQYELALLAMAQAQRGGRRQYDVSVPDRSERSARIYLLSGGQIRSSGSLSQGRVRVQVLRDQQPCLDWQLDGGTIASPAPYAGRSLQRLRGWMIELLGEGTLDDDALEAALLLRRCLQIGDARSVPLDAVPNADHNPALLGGCFVMQPERAFKATRMQGSTHDFSDSPAALLRGFDER